MATEIPFLDESEIDLDEREIDEDDRPTLPALVTPLSFDTASEAFFIQPLQRVEKVEWPADETTQLREYRAERRRRRFGAWVAVVVAGSVTLLAAAWLPLIGGWGR